MARVVQLDVECQVIAEGLLLPSNLCYVVHTLPCCLRFFSPTPTQAVSAHFLWLSFLTEQWAVIARLRDARTAAARVMYGRLLAASLQDPAVLSHHPAALGAYFRLLTLGLKYGRSCLRGGPATAGKDVLLLFDRILRAVSGVGVDNLGLTAWCMMWQCVDSCIAVRCGAGNQPDVASS